MNKKIYKFTLILILLISSATSLYADAKDSIEINQLNEKVKILESKVDVLNDANNKLITISWAVIGIVAGLFAIIIGLNFWSNFKLNTQRIDNIKSELKSYLEIDLFDKHKETIDKIIKSKIDLEVSALKRNDKITQNDIREIHIQLLKKELDEVTLEYGYYKIEKLISLLNLNREVEEYHNLLGNSIGVHDTLNLILNYIKGNSISVDDKKNLFENLSKLDGRYKIHIEEIEKNIKV